MRAIELPLSCEYDCVLPKVVLAFDRAMDEALRPDFNIHTLLSVQLIFLKVQVKAICLLNMK